MTRTKYEYCELELRIGGPLTGRSAKLIVYTADPKQDHTMTDENFGDALADLGEEGWEMCGSSARIETGLGGGHRINYIFKRELLAE